MTRFIIGVVIVSLAVAFGGRAAEPLKMPEPVKEHAWLQQFVGEWEYEAEMTMQPGEPPMRSKGTESTRAIGGFWILGENKGIFFEKPFTGILTLGYDPESKKFIGTWVDSVGSYLWRYEGTLDESGKILTLTSEGPCPAKPGQLVKVKETLEVIDKDHKVFTSRMQGDDGTWNTMGKIDYRRTK